jgi:hypothetical protein
MAVLMQGEEIFYNLSYQSSALSSSALLQQSK